MDRPVPPRSPRTHGGMMHVIHHRFKKTVKVKSVMCGLCEKPMFIGFKCMECKYKCHRDCVDKVPPSCGLPSGYMDVFKRAMANNQEGRRSPLASYSGTDRDRPNITSPSSVKSECYASRERSKRLKGHYSNPSLNVPFPDSSSNTSSCTSSTPSSPALLVNNVNCHTPYSATKTHHSFHFPDVSNPLATNSLTVNSSPFSPPSFITNSSSSMGPMHSSHLHYQHASSAPPTIEQSTISSVKSPTKQIIKEYVETQKSNDSDKTISGASGSTSTDSEKTIAGRLDSQDSQASEFADDRMWPRQNSLTAREWDIPFEQVRIGEKIGTGLFGTVHKGQWHSDVAVKQLNLNNDLDDKEAIEAFRQEVAMFRKTRHENIVLFMGACMKPPHLALITSLCKGSTLYDHIYVRHDRFTLPKALIVAEQISQGMSYLHSRGIIHKDLKTKNIFLESGYKIVITDFGLFSVTKLCQGNRKGDWLTIPKGWLSYLAPEVIRALRAGEQDDLPFSPASDVFAFGTVWYEVLLGDYPFRGYHPESIIWQVGRGVKQSLTNLQASKEIKDLLMICWTYDANERPEFSKLLDTLSKLPKKKLQRSPSHPIQMIRSAESIF